MLIIAGFALLAYGFYLKITDPDFRVSTPSPGSEAVAAASPPQSVPMPAGRAFGEVRLPLPEGCSVVEMEPDGGRLYLRTGPEGLCERIVVLDAATGAVIGTVTIRP